MSAQPTTDLPDVAATIHRATLGDVMLTMGCTVDDFPDDMPAWTTLELPDPLLDRFGPLCASAILNPVPPGSVAMDLLRLSQADGLPATVRPFLLYAASHALATDLRQRPQSDIDAITAELGIKVGPADPAWLERVRVG